MDDDNAETMPAAWAGGGAACWPPTDDVDVGTTAAARVRGGMVRHRAATHVGGGAALQHSARMLARVGGGAARRLQHDGDAAWRSGLPRTTAARCSGGKDDGGGTAAL
jgi:hypothetical protein